jgi:microcystin-dependent protein
LTAPYIGEIRLFGGNFAPVNWAFCDGQLMSIAENDTLYNLIGTTYGGDGVSTFGIPDMRGRVVAHWGQPPGGQNYVYGQKTGAETVTLTTTQLPQHTHTVIATTLEGNTGTPTTSTMLAAASTGTTIPEYAPPGGAQNLASTGSTVAIGGSQPHENMQPYLGVNFIIALYGIYPTQN